MTTDSLMMVRGYNWIDVNSYRVRVAAFALASVPVGLHVWPNHPAWWFWLVFALQFFVYPQLLQLRQRGGADAERTEFQNLAVDGAAFGAWAAGLGFPLWISVVLFLATLLNHAITRGWLGVMVCPVAILSGALASTTVIAFHVSSDTSGLVTLASIVGLLVYTSLMGIEFFSYIRRLREVQEAVGQQKETLELANLALHEQLEQIRDLQEKLREQVNRDSLTGLFNRRYLDGTLERELSRCRRENVPLTMLLLDLDHFKQVNDTHGHQAGDEVLRVLGRALLENARAEDIVCRYGGEEFMLVLPKMPLATAQIRAAQLLAMFRGKEVPFGDLRLRLTASIGIAAVPDHAATPEQLIRCADQAMYHAKAGGRDCISVFGSDAVQR